MKYIRKKTFFLIMLTLVSIYLLGPFINGLGCNYSFVAQSVHIKEIGKCNAGVMSVYYEVSDAKMLSYSRYIYGIDGDYIYLLRIDSDQILGENKESHSSSFYRDVNHAFNIFDSERFYVFKYKCSVDKKCYLLSNDSMENIYEMNISGRTGIFKIN